MIKTIIVSAVACAAVICLVLVKPAVTVKGHKFAVYWTPAFVGAIILILCGCVDLRFVAEGLTANTAVNPLKILVLFISMTLMSVYLDEVGFFRYLATAALKHAGHNGLTLFSALFFIVGALTVITSNDIVVLTFSPFICYFAKNAKINPLPYLIGEFVSANTWSMALIIGNPTNIFLATGAGINFAGYAEIMVIPTLVAGLTAYLVLLAIFGRSLKKESVTAETAVIHIDDKTGLIIGLVHLFGCTALLVVASYIKWEMWYICLAFAVSLFACVSVHKLIHKETPKEIKGCLKRAPWELVPFVLSMFIIVLGLKENGITTLLADRFDGGGVFAYGTGAYVLSNVINNIPASVLFEAVFAAKEVSAECVYAAIAGTNIGAFLTPVGALAGIMWSGILAAHDVKFGFGKFVLYGAMISVPVLLAALGGLELAFLIF
ncbi:MAG: SLC13 family permease [Christensenellales bacterium]